MKRLAIIGLAVVMVMGLAGFGWADVITYTLGDGNAALDPYASPYANVIVTWISGTQATITVDASGDYLIGDGAAVALNVNGVNAVASGITWTGGKNSGQGIKTAFSAGGAGNVSEFGLFNFTLNNTDGWATAVTSVTFTLTSATAAWTSAADVLTNNASGYLAASHIFVPPTGAVTGFAGNSVPEPGTLALLGAGLVGVGLLRRKFRK